MFLSRAPYSAQQRGASELWIKRCRAASEGTRSLLLAYRFPQVGDYQRHERAVREHHD